MTSGIKLSYDYIYSFIKNKGCELLEEKREIKAKEKIKIKCSCGNIMIKCFDRIRKLEILLCTTCTKKKRKSDEIKKVLNKKMSIIEENGYTFLSGSYEGDKEKTLILKDSENYYYKTCIKEITSSIRENNKARRFSKANPFTIENIINWITIEKRPFAYIEGEYIKALKSTLKFKCLLCLECWFSSWAKISQLQGCPYCAGKKIGKNNSLGILFPELVKEWGNNNKSPFEVIPGSHTSYTWNCKECGYIWKTSANKRTGEKTGCPKCNKSKGEGAVLEYLILNNIKYFYQHIFKDCFYKNPLRFDFYLPEYNYCIEYQGEQHYKPVKFSNKTIEHFEEEFLKNKTRDDIKKEWCSKSKIFLLEIPYWEFDNIENILIKTFKNNNTFINREVANE